MVLLITAIPYSSMTDDCYGVNVSSQKALGAPPGLCIAAFSQRALVSLSPTLPSTLVHPSLSACLPIM
jgi:aspartate aminotransferase-like enzyme